MAKKPGLPKKYIKQANGDFKKGWALYRKAKAGAQKQIKAITKTVKKGVGTMAKKPQVRYVTKKAMPISKEVLSGATTAVSVLGSNFLVNQTPGVKNLDPKMKAGAQIAGGALLASMSRRKPVKWIGAGMVVAGILNLSKEFPATASLSGAEDSPTLSPEEMALLTEDRSSLLGVPESTYRPMGKPVSWRAPANMGKPVSWMSGEDTTNGWKL